MNKYRVLKGYEDGYGAKHAVGDIVLMPETAAIKLIKQGFVQLDEDLTQKLVDLRYDGQRLFLYNVITGARIGEVTQNGIVGRLIGEVVGNVIGAVTGNVTGDLTGDVTGDLTGLNFVPIKTYEADGAIDIGKGLVLLDGSAATCKMTLEDGAKGQKITIKAVDATNDCEVTPAHFADGTNLALEAKAAVTLVFDGTNWCVVGTYKTVTVS